MHGQLLSLEQARGRPPQVHYAHPVSHYTRDTDACDGGTPAEAAARGSEKRQHKSHTSCDAVSWMQALLSSTMRCWKAILSVSLWRITQTRQFAFCVASPCARSASSRRARRTSTTACSPTARAPPTTRHRRHKEVSGGCSKRAPSTTQGGNADSPECLKPAG